MGKPAPVQESRQQRGFRLAKSRGDSLIQAQWTLMFALGFTAGHWVPLTPWGIALGALGVGFVVFAVRYLRFIIAETAFENEMRVRRFEPEPQDETTPVTVSTTERRPAA